MSPKINEDIIKELSKIIKDKPKMPQLSTPRNNLFYDELYNLQFMESTYYNGQTILRVPGGWIFEGPKGSVFVPYVDKEDKLNL